MPAVVVNELRYEQQKDRFYVYLYNLLSRLQFLKKGQYLFGKLIFAKIDKKVEKEINNAATLEIEDSNGIFDYFSNEDIKKLGITPNSWICLVLESYATSTAKYATRYPIYPEYFEIVEVPDVLREEVESKFRGAEEVIRLLEYAGIVEELKEPYEQLKEGYRKFKINFFADSKTSIRKSLEPIKKSVSSWVKIDDSEHLADGIKKFLSALYDLSSSGGPHPGTASRDETEVILNSTLFLFKYINKLIKEGRIEIKTIEKA